MLAVQGVDDGVDGALAAVGHRNTDAFGIGITACTPARIAATASVAVIDSLNESGARTIFIRPDVQSGFDMGFIVD